MELIRITDRIHITTFEPERDRPSLAHVRGDRLSLAIDAGHSPLHVAEFYESLRQKSLPIPDVTAITHWHWDHTFGMCAIEGISVTEKRTADMLLDVINNWNGESEAKFKKDAHVALEYENQSMRVVPSDIVYNDRLELDLGGVHAVCFHIPSPHTHDAAFILIPEERVLFVGDGICGEYPTWYMDPVKRDKLVDDLRKIDFDTAIGGHWDPFTKEGLIGALLGGELG